MAPFSANLSMLPAKRFRWPTCNSSNWQLATSNWQLATPTVASGNININIKIRHSLWLPSHFHSMPKRKAPHNFRAAFPRLGKWICGER